MRLNVEVAILEKSILVGLVQNCLQKYLEVADLKALDEKRLLQVISDEIERVKELNLVSFYGVQSLVKLEPEILKQINEKEDDNK